MIVGNQLSVSVQNKNFLFLDGESLDISRVLNASYYNIYVEDIGIDYIEDENYSGLIRNFFNVQLGNLKSFPSNLKKFSKTYLWLIKRDDISLIGKKIKNLEIIEEDIYDEYDILNIQQNLYLGYPLDRRVDIDLNNYPIFVDYNDLAIPFSFDENFLIIMRNLDNQRVVLVFYNDFWYNSNISMLKALTDIEYTIEFCFQIWEYDPIRKLKQKLKIINAPVDAEIYFNNFDNEVVEE
jgi:hypothetical protein